jgi:adenylate kinase family enzyme
VDRVVIVGCGGSGKTYLARELGARLGLPVTHLDTVYYDRDWQPLSHDDFAATQKRLVAEPRWVIDGNYASTLPIRLRTANTVIFCDLSTLACLRSILERRRRHGAGQHDDLGVYDRITPAFIRYVLGYRRTMRPRVLQLIAEHARHTTMIVLSSRSDTRRYLSSVHRSTEASPTSAQNVTEQIDR